MIASLVADTPDARPIHAVEPATFEAVLKTLTEPQRAFAAAMRFEPKPGRHLVLPGPQGEVAGVLFGVQAAGAPGFDPFSPGRLPGASAGRHLRPGPRLARARAGGARLGLGVLSVRALQDAR